MVTFIVTATACLLVLVGEVLHQRRIRRVAVLAFGPKARPAVWVHIVPLLRVGAVGLLAWGLVTLMQLTPKVHRADHIAEDEYRHMLLVLDVSPSMRLQDAGQNGEQSRRLRARDLLQSLFSRVSMSHYLVTVIATYNGAKPVVVDTKDAEVVRNILDDLPMQYAFKSGKTKLFDGLEYAAKVAKPWRSRSTLLVLVSDGDTVPATGMPKMPPSILNTLVVGVGDPITGRFIDGRQSRQDASTLRQIAMRLGGVYHNGNRQHIATETIRQLTDAGDKAPWEKLTMREYALLATALGSLLLALLPLLLHYAGSSWRPGAFPRPEIGKSTRKAGPTLQRQPAATR